MTGLWQVSGRTGTSYERRVQLDSWYVRNWSIWQDLAIMVQTVPAVLKRRGAI
jgi:lipopolysaccharide/colanic/teichoic acid biosynthesis glycosyltransferase